MPSSSIVVAGSLNTDMILNVSRMPRPGETVLGGSFAMVGGGKGANQAIAAARTGGNVSFVGRVGEDGFGQQSLCAFKDAGIGVDHVAIDASIASGVALIFVGPDGENSIGVAEGANGRVSVEQIQEAAPLIQSAHILLVQLEIPLDSVRLAVSLAAEHGVRVILNPAPAASLDEDLLHRVSILTPNELEAETLTEMAVRDPDSAARAAKKLLSRGVETVLLTLGAAGVLLSDGRVEEFFPGHQVSAVDTTGAGDVFNGALATSLSLGDEMPVAVRFANAAAAMSVTKPGAQSSIPIRSEVDAFLGRN